MKSKGIYNELHPGITMHQIPVKAGFAGLVFTIGTMAVFLMGIPALIYFFVLAIVLGIGVAVMLRFIPHQAGFVVLVLTGVMIAWLAGIPRMGWPEQLPMRLLLPATMAPPPAPPPPENGVLVFRCDCDQGYSCAGQQSEAATKSAFVGTWEGQMKGLPGISLIMADASGGTIGGVVTFYFQRKGDDGKWRVAGKFTAPLLSVCPEGKALIFEIQHHKTHRSRQFGPNVRFRMELSKNNQATLENLDEDIGAIRLTRRD